jgi:hypothetical protein
MRQPWPRKLLRQGTSHAVEGWRRQSSSECGGEARAGACGGGRAGAARAGGRACAAACGEEARVGTAVGACGKARGGVAAELERAAERMAGTNLGCQQSVPKCSVRLLN